MSLLDSDTSIPVYRCEWGDCTFSSNDEVETRRIPIFFQHLRGHLPASNLSPPDSQLTCQWQGCNEPMETIPELKFHLNYHGYHAKLISNGIVSLNKLEKTFGRAIICKQDSSFRNQLPDLPDTFMCLWKHCDADFEDPESYYVHVATHAMEDVPIPSMSKEELKKTRYAQCQWENCNMSFFTRNHLKHHLRTHTQEKVVACPVCGQMFTDAQKLNDHVLRQASEADIKATSSSMKRTRHRRRASTAEVVRKNAPSPSKCPVCGQEFITQRLLDEHYRAHHGSGLKCNLCGFVAGTSGALLRHRKYRHEEERPFGCQFCDQSFKSKSDLRKHIYVHNDENHFRCSECSDFSTRSYDSLAKHIRQEHSGEGPEVYKCHICPKTYNRGNNLSRHLARSHRLKPPLGASRFKYIEVTKGVYSLQNC